MDIRFLEIENNIMPSVVSYHGYADYIGMWEFNTSVLRGYVWAYNYRPNGGNAWLEIVAVDINVSAKYGFSAELKTVTDPEVLKALKAKVEFDAEKRFGPII